jgi:hypothetical protein
VVAIQYTNTNTITPTNKFERNGQEMVRKTVRKTLSHGLSGVYTRAEAKLVVRNINKNDTEKSAKMRRKTSCVTVLCVVVRRGGVVGGVVVFYLRTKTVVVVVLSFRQSNQFKSINNHTILLQSHSLTLM